ncbi:hypothetical protein VTK73DRAFT_2819 [Phialemonium thermophilum]|uniref:mitogen-activated protein kinase kinase n=1 Tax=Phialemonium thermophilum TaxID=223376 RepID=A0ABR3X2C2_9PEZI
MAHPQQSEGDALPATPDGQFPDSNAASPLSVSSSQGSTPLDPSGSSSDGVSPMTSATSPASPDQQRRVPSLRTVSDPESSTLMNPTSSVSGTLTNARRPPPSAGSLPLDLMQKARALQQQRMGRPPLSAQTSGASLRGGLDSHFGGSSSPVPGLAGMNVGVALPGGVPGGLARPVPPGFRKSEPVVPSSVRKPPSLSERRAMRLGGLPGGDSPKPLTPKLSDIDGGGGGAQPAINGEGRGSKLSDFKDYIDAEKGWITFEGAATITRTGVNFANGQTFSISLDEVEVLDELGKGNYGTVFKVRHCRPKVPRFGLGLSHFRASRPSDKNDDADESSALGSTSSSSGRVTSGVIMAMKEIRLELDESKFGTILKELVILHECVSPYIIDFYGAFFQEGAVYMCIEYMDGGSIDKLYSGGIPEPVLRKITYATIMGLKTLKDDHNIIHRDVKPTNILVNTFGQVKICDFGVSGNLVASIAKTNIGCQSYMAPERISGGGMAAGAGGGAGGGTYNVQSDIWSLGLTIIECAMGRYPYPPEVSSTIFSQLNAIVEGEPPNLPTTGYSPLAHDFVRSCVNKIPAKRHTYPMLLAHPWMKPLTQPDSIAEDSEAEEAAAQGADLAEATSRLDIKGGGVLHDREVAEWVRAALERKNRDMTASDGGRSSDVVRPALHAAPLDRLSPANRSSFGNV